MCNYNNSRGCACNQCQPLNQSNKTVVVPVSGADAYQTWLAYHPDKDPKLNPTSPWTEIYWLENYAKGQKGDKGDGIQIKGSVATYADLASITPTPEQGDSYVVNADGLLYVYGESGFPLNGQGAPFKGDAGADGQQEWNSTEW